MGYTYNLMMNARNAHRMLMESTLEIYYLTDRGLEDNIMKDLWEIGCQDGRQKELNEN
jgi:hypothetical protein